MNIRSLAQDFGFSSLAKVLVVGCTVMTAACGGGGSTKAEATPQAVSDSPSTSQDKPSAGLQTQVNKAPVISGTPSQSIKTGASFDFMPQATDSDGDVLAFSISNKPSWASFNTANGRLSGTPTQAGHYTNVAISVSDGKTSSQLNAFSIQVVAETVTPSNGAPAISGQATASINVGQSYNFIPTAVDAEGDALTFSIANKPSWATFNTATGQLSGTPTAEHVGSYANVTLTVSDGTQSATLAPFAIAVTASSNGAASLSWTPPTQNTDGSALTNLSGYRIRYGTSAGSLDQTIEIKSAGVAQYVVDNLSPGTWYFAVNAINGTGAESDLSATVSKKI